MKKLIFCCILFVLSISSYSQPEVQDSIIQKVSVIQNFDPDVATQQYLDTLTGEAKEKSDSYFEGGYWLLLWNLLYEIGIAFIFLFLGLSGWIHKQLSGIKNVNLRNMVYIACYVFIFYVMIFPLTVYEDFFREHQYGLSNLTFGAWLGEQVKTLLLATIMISFVGMLIYVAIRKTRKNWWLWGAALSCMFLFVFVLLMPVYVSPLFNNYKPLQDEKVKNELMSIARANQIPAEDIYQFDASKQTSKISANVSGFASTVRISLNDNLLNRCELPEIKAVMAHEMGHYVLNHLVEKLIYLSILIVAGFAFLAWSATKLIKRWGERWKISGIADIKSLPLLVVLFLFFMFITEPVRNNITRINEIEADIFGLNVAREPDGFAGISMKLSQYRKINPGNWEEIIFYDHPSGKTRVWTAMKWKSEHLND